MERKELAKVIQESMTENELLMFKKRFELLKRYNEIILEMNHIVDSIPPREAEESGYRYVSPEFAGLVHDRTRIALALADEEVGVSFKGWPK